MNRTAGTHPPLTIKRALEGVTRALRDDDLSAEQVSELKQAIASADQGPAPDRTLSTFSGVMVVASAAAAAALMSSVVSSNGLLALGAAAAGGVVGRVATGSLHRHSERR